MKWSLALTEPDLGEEEIAAVTSVIRNKWLTQGEVTAEFERKFAAKMGVKHAIAVSNCTAGLHLAYSALGLGPGDEVICPSLTFVATANAARYTGADVVFAKPVSSNDLTVSPADIAGHIGPKTKAIAVVHYAGFPCLMDRILGIAREHGLAVVEDCAHAPFAWLPGNNGSREYVGAIGEVGCFSFFGNKNMTTGEGGMVTTNSDSLAEKIRLLRSHGMTTLTYDRHKGHASQYDVVALGYNYRLDEIRSALGLCQLGKIDRLNARRREVYADYVTELAGSGVRVAFCERDLAQSACHILPALVPTEIVGRVKEALRNCLIQTSKHYEPVPSFSLYRPEGETPGPLFGDEELLTLPLGPAMSTEQVRFVARTIVSAAGRGSEAVSLFEAH